MTREQQLQAIGDVIEYWIKWASRTRALEDLETRSDTHVMFGYENAPPHWPTVGQLRKWLEVLRDTDRSGEADETAKQAQPEGREPGPSEETASPKSSSPNPIRSHPNNER